MLRPVKPLLCWLQLVDRSTRHVMPTRFHRVRRGDKKTQGKNSVALMFHARGGLYEEAAVVWKTPRANQPCHAFRVHRGWLTAVQANSNAKQLSILKTQPFGTFPQRYRSSPRILSWILAELRSESRSPPRRGPPKEPRAVAGRQRAPSADFRARLSKGGPRGRRRLRVDDACPDSTSGSEPSTGSRAGSRSPSAAVRRQDHDGGSRGRLPPRNGRRGESTRGWAGGASESGAERRLSTRSADGTAEDVLGDAAVLRGSTLSGGSARSSTMGAR